MDPLSVTLTIVSLTTAVKDMVELGQKIHKSFAKVSDNLRNAQRVARDIKEMVEEIRDFCEDHKDTLDDMTDFRLALQGLVAKFRNLETSILPLLPQTGGRRRDRLIQGWDAWRNNNKVEEHILDLQSDIVKVMRRYMMKSTMRTEIKLETIQQETSRGLEVLEFVRRDVSALRIITAATTTTHRSSFESSETTSDELSRNVIMFAQSTPSTSAPMLRTSNIITEELMTTAYIKFQLNKIAMTVEKMSRLPASAPNSGTPFQMSLVLKQVSASITHLRHHVVRQVIGIRDLLETERIHTISIRKGARALEELSTGLEALGMGEECMLVGQWAITLARTLVDASGNGQSDPAAKLALHLRNQSIRYCASGNKIQSLQLIDEAYTITQNLRNQYSHDAHYQILHSDILLQHARLVDNKRSIEMSVEAVQLLEDILNVQAFTQSKLHGGIEQVVQPGSFLDQLFSLAPSAIVSRNYANALQGLGTYLSGDGQTENALDLALLAIAVHRKMALIHGDEYKVDLAMALLWLVRGGITSCIPAEKLVNMADECTYLLRELTEKNPLYYARELVMVLWRKADALERLDQATEAIATWEEVVGLAGQIVQDSELCAAALGNLSNQFRRLKRYDDAVRTATLAITTYHESAETRAARYFYLSEDLQHLRRYKESADAARTSVALYRRLAMREPRTWASVLTAGLSNLAHCLAASGDYSEALIAWRESVTMLDNFFNTDPDASSAVNIDEYLAALYTQTFIGHVLDDDEECLMVSFQAVRYLCYMSQIYPQKANIIQDLLHSKFCLAYNMLSVGRLQDAREYIDGWFDVWSRKLEAISTPEIAEYWHVAMMNLKGRVLDAQGCTEQALLATQKTHDTVRPSLSAFQVPFDMVDSMILAARLQVKLGNSEKAIYVAEGALGLSRENKRLGEPIVSTLVLSLYGVAFAALSCRDYRRASEAAREGCDILARPENLDYWQRSELYSLIRPSILALLSSAEANLGRCSTAVQYAHRAVDASLHIGDMKSHISTATAEWSYMETRGNLAEILLATGDLVQARRICAERSVYFAKRVEQRMGDYHDLVPILRMLGILCCSEGLHEEGDAAAQELSRIVRILGSAFPSLLEQVNIRLRNQAKIPIFKVLEDLSKKLDCEHQTEIVLFAI